MDGVIGEGGCDAIMLKQEAPHCPLVFGQIQIDLSANVLLSHVCLTFVTVCILFQFSHFSSILIFLYCVVFSYSLFGLIFTFLILYFVFCVAHKTMCHSSYLLEHAHRQLTCGQSLDPR